VTSEVMNSGLVLSSVQDKLRDFDQILKCLSRYHADILI